MYVLLFDGVCNLCNASVQWVLLRDKKKLFRFAALQSDVGQELLARYRYDGPALDSVVLADGDRLLLHTDAAIGIAVRLGGWWRAAAILYAIPRPLRDAVYRFIARHRYRWFGRREQCMLPRPEWKDRFL